MLSDLFVYGILEKASEREREIGVKSDTKVHRARSMPTDLLFGSGNPSTKANPGPFLLLRRPKQGTPWGWCNPWALPLTWSRGSLPPSPGRRGLTSTGVKMSFHFWKAVFAKSSVLSVTQGTNASSSSSSSCWSCSFLVYNYNAARRRKDPFHLDAEPCHGLAGTSSFLHFTSCPQTGKGEEHFHLGP